MDRMEKAVVAGLLLLTAAQILLLGAAADALRHGENAALLPATLASAACFAAACFAARKLIKANGPPRRKEG
jgi:hypothetical protein